MTRLFALLGLAIAVLCSVASASSKKPASASIKTTWPVRAIAADGKRVAFVARMRCPPQSCLGPVCATVRVWRPARSHVARLQDTCPNDFVPYIGSVALAGARAAWLQTYSGTTATETVVMTATPVAAKPVEVAYAATTTPYGGYGTSALAPVGDGPLLVFTVETRCQAAEKGDDGPPCPPGRKDHDVIRATVWRIPGDARCPSDPIVRRCARVAEGTSELTALAVNTGRILVRTSDGVSVMTPTGRHVRDLPVDHVRAAALSGNRVALRVPGAIEIYDTGSGERVEHVPVSALTRLEDFDRGILVTAVKKSVKVRRLANGRTATIHTRGVPHARLETSGLFVAGGRHITFTPMGVLLRKTGNGADG